MNWNGFVFDSCHLILIAWNFYYFATYNVIILLFLFCDLYLYTSILFVRISFVFNSCYIALIEWIFYYFAIFKYMSTTVPQFRGNGAVQLPFFFPVMGLIVIIDMSSCWHQLCFVPFVTLVPCFPLLELENGLLVVNRLWFSLLL